MKQAFPHRYAYRGRELANYAVHVWRHRKMTSAIKSIGLWILFRLRGKVKQPYLYSLPEAAMSSELASSKIAARPCFLNLKPLSSESQHNPHRTLTLATQVIRWDAAMNWNVLYPDVEDTYALHRFGWLLQTIQLHYSTGEGLHLWDTIIHWLTRRPTVGKGPAWQPYTVSERIVHWVMFHSLLAQSGLSPLPQEDLFLNDLRLQLKYVASHLEYYGEQTNNHLTNNGRALYIGGQCIGDQACIQLGRQIVQHQHSIIFTPNGFLRESSSHYHLLLMRTYIELLEAASTLKDHAFKTWLEIQLKEMIKAARFFMPDKDTSLPLLGDVSPDFQPAWFKGFPYFHSTTSEPAWCSLWSNLPTAPSDVSPMAHGKFTSFQDEGWHRYDNILYRVYWHVQNEGFIPDTSHGHHDTGGFELHCEGQPILVDTGRVTYDASPIGLYGLSAAAHNLCTIDGLEPFVSSKLNGLPFFYGGYSHSRTQIHMEDRPEQTVFDISHNGFERLGGTVFFQRRFILKENMIALEDDFSGTGNHRVESFFHFHPHCRIERNQFSFVIDWPGTKHKVSLMMKNRPETIELMEGVYFPRYGTALSSKTLRIRQKASFPLKNEYEIRFANA